MVKNIKGGNKSKGFARKFLNSSNISSIRVPTDPLEQFAIVHKMYGTICDVITHDMNMFKCHIRGKFRGRSKRNSIVSVGKLVLIGFRDFETPFKNTDLLEIYDSQDILSIQNIPSFQSIIFSLISINNTQPSLPTPIDDFISFSNTITTTTTTTTPISTTHTTTTHTHLSDDDFLDI